VFEKLGFVVEIAANGREAIELAARNQYAAIFMDCQMPEVDGYEATREIRRREGERRRVPIIAMTANTLAGERDRCLAAGMDDYLPKPLRFDHLTDVCRRLVPTTEAPAAPAVPATEAPAAPAVPSTEAPAAPAAFRPEALEQIVAPDQVRQLLTLFLEQLDESLPKLADAVEELELETAEQIAHRLAGSADTVGAPTVAAACRAVCAHARRQEAGELPVAMAALSEAVDATTNAVDRYVATPSRR